jgi:transcriptional regulator with XRE-family HTH domain
VRRSRNLSQADLAQKAHIPASYISDLEKGKSAPGIDLVDRLAKALDASLGELLPLQASAETPDQLREQVRTVLDEVLRRADRDVIVTVNSVLTLLRELSTRRR